jgi:hypothetical protein
VLAFQKAELIFGQLHAQGACITSRFVGLPALQSAFIKEIAAQARFWRAPAAIASITSAMILSRSIREVI